MIRRTVFFNSCALLLLLLVSSVQAQKFDSLAMTPPMGWNSWNTFSVNIDEKLIKGIADSFMKDGLKDAGYQYIVIDDGWMAKERDKNGNLVADPVKFPSGMKAVVDYVHSKGLKFGIYNCAGNKTCGGYPGSRGHEYQDALLYASWGVDYLKYDWCNTEKINAEGAYITMRDALYAAGRPVVFSLCEWGDNQPWTWGKDVGHLWRTTGDISNCWDCEDDHGTWSSWGVLRTVNMRKDIRQYAGPGHWNDPDMMEVGNGMTLQEDRSHFSLWCMLAAPLIMGNDLRTMKPETREILTNKDAIAINQDALGVQALRYTTVDSVEVWVKPLVNDEWAVCFLNLKSKPQAFTFSWQDNAIVDEVSKRTLHPKKESTYQLKNLWTKKNEGTTSKPFYATIASHDVAMFRLYRK
jgi:alpha-galactosidase